ncbi:uncharacterized protein K460DRAFT_405260 [Cucurbitaria berberidis CBS 394.84]|uniref:Uncharacterized protein n=1 Tax=Cucurbitaria berberidis CBS 394.84 TaxID=1168544 RepID=A0A9P4GG71_9PLEO|nr:uncharacterized protein K460DRAFT_405260 [Cucurbitaria berberidis CBS 394.84]KAF1844980.1 hypothetical protein K460DRAFT_405260 [Cucurbitaria berberidis CBS 394.84]
MVDYNLYTVNDHLKPILRAGGVTRVTGRKKTDMIAWCEKYDRENAPRTALDLVPNLPPLKTQQTNESRSATLNATQSSKSKGVSTDSSAPRNEDTTQPHNASNDVDGDVEMGDVRDLELEMLAKERPGPVEQVPVRIAEESPESRDYHNWSDEKLVEAILRRSGKDKLDGRVSERHQWITTLHALDRVAGVDGTNPGIQSNNGHGNPNASSAHDQGPTVPSISKPRKRKQPAGEGTSQSISESKGRNRPARKKRAVHRTSPAQAPEPKQTLHLRGLKDPVIEPTPGTHIIVDCGTERDMRFIDRIPRNGLNNFEQVQLEIQQIEADIRVAAEAGVPYKEPSPPPEAWDWRVANRTA